MHIATLQVGDEGTNLAKDAATAAQTAAADAMAAYEDAKTASEAAAAATTGADVEEAWRDAVKAQEAAEAAAMTAREMAEKAAEAAMTELHINDTVKTVGESMVDADADVSISPPVPDTAREHTGFLYYVERTSPAVVGKAFVHTTNRSLDQAYVQAVEGRQVRIGKTLDTTDDAARLTVIHSRVGSKKVSVYVRDDSDETALLDFVSRISSKGAETQGLLGDGTNVALTAVGLRKLKPLGMYYEAADVRPTLPADATTPTIYARGTDESMGETFGKLIVDADDTEEAATLEHFKFKWLHTLR